MFCRYCGEENPDGSMFCVHCGKKIGKDETDMTEVIPEEKIKKSIDDVKNDSFDSTQIIPEEEIKKPSIDDTQEIPVITDDQIRQLDEETGEGIVCRRCGTVNSPTAGFCKRVWGAFDI